MTGSSATTLFMAAPSRHFISKTVKIFCQTEKLYREADGRLQAAQRGLAEVDIPAMGAGDGQPQARAAGLQIAAFVQAMERPEGFLVPRLGYARPVILDHDLGQPRVAGQRHRHVAAMLEAIVDQVGQAAL